MSCKKCSGKYKYHLQKCEKYVEPDKKRVPEKKAKVTSAKMPKSLLREGVAIIDMQVGDRKGVTMGSLNVDSKGRVWLTPEYSTWPIDELTSDVIVTKSEDGYHVEVYSDFVYDYYPKKKESYDFADLGYLPIKTIKKCKRDKYK